MYLIPAMAKHTRLDLDKLEFDSMKLRQARLRAFPDRSMRQVAREIFNVAPQSLSMWELGNTPMPPTMLLRMCAAYNITDPMYLTTLRR